MTSEKLIERFLVRYMGDQSSAVVQCFREDMAHLVRSAKAEQHIETAEIQARNVEYERFLFSIDSWR